MWFYRLAILLVLTLFSNRSFADAGNFHLIKGINVEATAENATIARNKAISNGERTAFSILIQRLIPQGDEIPKFTSSEIKDTILSRQIRNEKISSSSYRGIIDVKFSKQRVEQFLKENRLQYIKPQNEKILIIPIFRTGNNVSLWEEENPWKNAWSGAKSDFASFVIPFGDIEDITTANKYDVIKENIESIENLAFKYDVENVAIVDAFYEPVDNTITLKTKYFDGVDFNKSEKVISGKKGEELNSLLKKSVSEANNEIYNLWKQSASTTTPMEAGLQILIPIKSLAEWSDIRQRLSNVKQIESLKLNALAYGQADIGVVLSDAPENLVSEFRQAGLNLSKEGSYWILTKY